MPACFGRGDPRDGSSVYTDKIHRHLSPLCSFLLSLVLLLSSGASPILSIHVETLESHSEFTCEPIRLRMCQDLSYNTTFMPNLLNHYDQQTAALAMEVGCVCMRVRVCSLNSVLKCTCSIYCIFVGMLIGTLAGTAAAVFCILVKDRRPTT